VIQSEEREKYLFVKLGLETKRKVCACIATGTGPRKAVEGIERSRSMTAPCMAELGTGGRRIKKDKKE